MPGLKIHGHLTAATLGLLPAKDRASFGSEQHFLVAEACGYPDQYYSRRAEVEEYLCFTDGEPFHYPPAEPVEYNNWRVEEDEDGCRLEPVAGAENLYFKHCWNAFNFYFERLPLALREGRHRAAASYAGALLHVLQDSTMPGHGLEGFDGIDIMALSRLIGAPVTDPDWDVTMALGAVGEPALLPDDHRPELLGLSAGEAAFNGYTRLYEAVAANRLLFLPLARAHLDGDGKARVELERDIMGNVVRLGADFIFTALRLADGVLDSVEVEQLSQRDLSVLRPVRMPRYASAPYRFTPWRSGYSLDAKRRRVSLQTLDAAGGVTSHDSGMGLGCHRYLMFEYYIPAGVYRALTALIGPHAELGRSARLAVRLCHGDAVVWRERFEHNRAAVPVDVDVVAGGWLRIEAESLTDKPLDTANQWVIARPLLVK